jgi:hypothetical protein
MPTDSLSYYKGYRPPDLQKTEDDAASAASKTATGSYDKIIRLPLVKNKKYRFWFTYMYEDPETKKLTEGPRSPVVESTFDIPNLTKPVLNLAVTASYRAYGVKFDFDPTSVQEDILIYESLTGLFTGEEYIVYVGNSTNVTIQTGSTDKRWVKVVVRDKWLDTNRSSSAVVEVTPLNPDPDTTFTVENPTTATASASIDPKDLSGFSVVSTINWSVSTDTRTAGYSIRWSTTNPSSGTPLWEYASVSGRTTNTYTATGLIPNTTYYYQVTSLTPYDVPNWSGVETRTFIASDADGTAAGALARLKSFIAIGGVSQDLFKIGTGIAQSINLNTEPLTSPTLTAGTYHGIILNKSTTNVGNNFWLTTGQFRVGNSTEFMYWNGTDLNITGSINATGGKFTGNVQLAVPTGGTTSGSLYAGASATGGARLKLNDQGLFAYDGLVTDATVAITKDGTIDARKGYIGGWTIAATSQTSGTISRNNTILDSNGNIAVGDKTGTLGSAVRLSATDPTYRIWVGSTSSSNAPFRVDTNGKLYATGAVFTGSTSIDGYATTLITNGLASRLTTVESGQTTLTSSIATKNAIFVQSTQPTATKAGDLWIHDTTGETKTWTGSSWTTRTNTTYATKVALDTKLEAGGFAVATASNQITSITSNGIVITPGTFKINTSNGTTPTTGAYVILNSAGLTAYDGTKTTFAITSSNGSAAFSGNISGSSFSGGTIVIGADESSTGYINTSATKGGVTTMVIKAIGHASTSNSGWTTSCYPWSDGGYSLGTADFSWNRLYLNGDAYFANGTTYKIDASADAFLNGYGVSGGYGVTSNWSPRTNDGFSLGISTRRWSEVWSSDTSINSSDIRLKKDIVNSALGLNFINLLRPVSYKWKETGFKEVLEEKTEIIDKQGDEKSEVAVYVPKIIGEDENGKPIVETTSREGSRDHYGFVAQEVKEVLDLIGVGDSFAGWVLDDHTDPESRQNLRYSEFISPLVKAVQELSDMVESLQQEVNTLKGI